MACLTGSCGSRGNGKTNAFSTIEIMEDSPVDVDVEHWFSMQNIGIEDPNTSSQLTSKEQMSESLMENKMHLLWCNQEIWAHKITLDWPPHLIWKQNPNFSNSTQN